MQKFLLQKFFDRTPVAVCQELLGKFLAIKQKWVVKKYMITDVEAYDGQEDEACHAKHGKTERNSPMFGLPGHRYVYMIYGMYSMLNIVTWPGTHPSAILIRWVQWFSGPGKLTKYIWIDKHFNAKIANEKTGLWIEDCGVKIATIHSSPRIGIDYASDKWKHKQWRFFIW